MKYAFVDIGNSSIKVQIHDHGQQRVTCNIGKSDASLRRFFTHLNIDRFLISSVVPSINKKIKDIKTSNILFLNHSHFKELSINVNPIESVGIDRLVNTIAIKYKWNTDTVIIDIGTCITFCKIKKDGEYCGGIIMPGFEMVRKALYSGAEQLPLINFPFHQPDLIGTTTEKAMGAGIFYGSIHMINGTISQLRGEQPGVKVILTGGAPRALIDQINADQFEPNLQFDGLNILYQKLNNEFN